MPDTFQHFKILLFLPLGVWTFKSCCTMSKKTNGVLLACVVWQPVETTQLVSNLCPILSNFPAGSALHIMASFHIVCLAFHCMMMKTHPKISCLAMSVLHCSTHASNWHARLLCSIIHDLWVFNPATMWHLHIGVKSSAGCQEVVVALSGHPAVARFSSFLPTLEHLWWLVFCFHKTKLSMLEVFWFPLTFTKFRNVSLKSEKLMISQKLKNFLGGWLRLLDQKWLFARLGQDFSD